MKMKGYTTVYPIMMYPVATPRVMGWGSVTRYANLSRMLRVYKYENASWI